MDFVLQRSKSSHKDFFFLLRREHPELFLSFSKDPQHKKMSKTLLCTSRIQPSRENLCGVPEGFALSQSSVLKTVPKSTVLKHPSGYVFAMVTLFFFGNLGTKGGGHGSPLQCSCLGNPMNSGAWRATVHGVSKSRPQLSTHAHTHRSVQRF